MRLLVVVPLRDEREALPAFLDSVARQTLPPTELLLVDDGSEDGSWEVIRPFAADHLWARCLRHPGRNAEGLSGASELQAFCWGVEQSATRADVIGKLDADLVLDPGTFAAVCDAFAADQRLGVAGPRLVDRREDGTLSARRCPVWHVEGAARFYRRRCLEEISPLPKMLGWDTIDEAHARMLGWRTALLDSSCPPAVHTRPMGSRDGLLRGYRRAGQAARALGAHPLRVAAATCVRLGDAPAPWPGVHYFAGWAGASGAPKAAPEIRRFVRREDVRRLRDAVRGRIT